MLCSSLHTPLTSSLLGPNILLSALFSKTLSLHSSLNFTFRSHTVIITKMLKNCCFDIRLHGVNRNGITVWVHVNNGSATKRVKLKFSSTLQSQRLPEVVSWCNLSCSMSVPLCIKHSFLYKRKVLNFQGVKTLHSVVSLALLGHTDQIRAPTALSLGNNPGTHWIGGWVGRRIVVGVL